MCGRAICKLIHEPDWEIAILDLRSFIETGLLPAPVEGLVREWTGAGYSGGMYGRLGEGGELWDVHVIA